MTTDLREDARPAPSEVRSSRAPALLALTLLAFATVFSVSQAARPVREPDTWWHLRLGDEFRDGWSLGDPGVLTPFAGQDWVPTQWLFEVIGSHLVAAAGVSSVPLLVASGAAAYCFIAFAGCRGVAGTLPATVATLGSLMVVSVFLVPRPQVATFVLLAAFAGAWLRSAEDLRPRWWLVPLTWVWACAHGMWFVGPLLGLTVTLGVLLERRASRRDLGGLLGVSVLGLVAAALTPVGPRLLLAPFRVSEVSAMVVEWQPPDFREPDALIALALVVAVVVGWARSTAPVPWSEVLVLVGALGWTVLSARTVALGAVIVAPLLARRLSAWTGDGEPRQAARRDLLVAGSAAVAGLLLVAALLRPDPAFVSVVGEDVDTALEEVPSGTVVFNEYAFGGWLEWRHRELVPVIDGLTESFAVEHIRAHDGARRVVPGWQRFVDGTGATYAVLYEATPLAVELEQRGWAVVAGGRSLRGGPVVLLERPGG